MEYILVRDAPGAPKRGADKIFFLDELARLGPLDHTARGSGGKEGYRRLPAPGLSSGRWRNISQRERRASDSLIAGGKLYD